MSAFPSERPVTRTGAGADRIGRKARGAVSKLEACARLLDLMPDQLTVEFTQHPGDDFYRPGSGLVSDWSPAEAS